MKDVKENFGLTDQEASSNILHYQGEEISYQPGEFDLCLCSNFFFDRCKNQSVDYHVATIKALCDVAKEVRIFPIAGDHKDVSLLVGPVMLQLQQDDFSVEIKQVSTEKDNGGNAMMRVWPVTCELK